jgi:aryl-alcohol dehydrogenase-like predicted oxidoreductase
MGKRHIIVINVAGLSPRHLEHREIIPNLSALMKQGISAPLTPVFPVLTCSVQASILTGKYNDAIPAESRASLKGYEWLKELITPDKLERVRKLQPIAADLGCTIAQLAIAWCLRNPNVSTVITGASRVEQVHENMKALEVAAKLTPDVMERIEGVLGNKPKENDE